MSGSLSLTTAGQAIWRTPRARLLVNGTERAETGIEQFTLTRTRYSRADTLEMTLALDRAAMPATGLWFDLPLPSDGSALTELGITLQMRDAADGGAQWDTVFTGIIDHVALSPAQTTVTIACRDYLARLLDMRICTDWMNMTGAEVITAMATAAGLTPQVSMPQAMTGQFWQVEHKRGSAASHSRFQTAFDLACTLATGAGCDLYTQGTTLVCAPYPTPTQANTHLLDYVDNGPEQPVRAGAYGLNFTRDYQIGRGVIVHVMAWDSRQRTKVDYYWSAAGGSTTPPAQGGTLHSFSMPGVRLDEARQMARCKYGQIMAHARTITGALPGRITLQPRDFMRLTDTGTTWDGTLDVDAVISRFSWNGGFSQQVTLRSRSMAGENAND